MNEIERMQALIKLALSWLDDSDAQDSRFIPNEPEQEKVAKTRTGACARQLLRTLTGDGSD